MFTIYKQTLQFFYFYFLQSQQLCCCRFLDIGRELNIRSFQQNDYFYFLFCLLTTFCCSSKEHCEETFVRICVFCWFALQSCLFGSVYGCDYGLIHSLTVGFHSFSFSVCQPSLVLSCLPISPACHTNSHLFPIFNQHRCSHFPPLLQPLYFCITGLLIINCLVLHLYLFKVCYLFVLIFISFTII